MALATRLRSDLHDLGLVGLQGRQVGRGDETQRDAGLAHERPQLRAHQAEQLGHRDVAEIDVDPAGLDLGDVQQVADEAELLLGHPADEADLGLLLAGERRLAVEEQFGQGDDRVQRRAQLVAHVGQEARLALVGVAQAIGAVVELGVEGHDAAVGAVELAVEAEQLVLARADLAERLQQLLVLARDLVVGARARAPRQLFAHGARAGGARAGRDALRHDDARAALGRALDREGVHQAPHPEQPLPHACRRAVAAGEHVVEVGDAGPVIARLDLERFGGAPEQDPTTPGVAERVARELRHGRRDAGLVLAVEPEDLGDVAGALARHDDRLLVTEFDARVELGAHSGAP